MDQTYTLVSDFRDFNEGDTFTKLENGTWRGTNILEGVNETLDTLLEVGGYLEEVEVEETLAVTNQPQTGDMYFYITGAGTIKEKEWTGSSFDLGCQRFMGVFDSREDAEARFSEVFNLLGDNA